MGRIEGNVLVGLAKDYEVSGMSLLRYKDRTWDLMDTGIKWEILDESCTTSISLHPGIMEDVTEFESFILVAWDGERRNRICGKVFNLLAGQDRVSEISGAIVAYEYFVVGIRKHRGGVSQVNGSA